MTLGRRDRRRSSACALGVLLEELDAPMAAAELRPTQLTASDPRSGTAGCCATTCTEHLTMGGTRVRTTWHQPHCEEDRSAR
ncbi:hypothetical protein [Kitasatospora aureofaciens]|uniref:hypothetical protein n=1 Tax=Kitasatospora aureofaciens TaxID=1894 RepID=UPI001C44EF7F|nr:hypothetical protein [Kitasatospora aureofaciens]MBV6696644.1 hypothetical protein [Kitasatospora aureofaciens]